jgi:uncharacterized protein (DUF983 family)
MQIPLTKALLHTKCPRCRRGDIFEFPLSSLSQFHKMNNSCPHCSIRLEPEPGFYQGAMYVGYALTVAVIVVVAILFYFLRISNAWISIAAVILIMIALIPANYRYSRTLYLYMFGGIKYDPTIP